MKRGIYFDLDGTVANLYGVEGWLADLEAENVRPYVVAKPMVNLSLLARYIHKAQQMGYVVGVISWLSKCGSPSYDEAVTTAKREWLAKHLPSVEWDEIHIVKSNERSFLIIKPTTLKVVGIERDFPSPSHCLFPFFTKTSKSFFRISFA